MMDGLNGCSDQLYRPTLHRLGDNACDSSHNTLHGDRWHRLSIGWILSIMK